MRAAGAERGVGAAEGALPDAPGAPLRRAQDPAVQPRRRRDNRLDLGEELDASVGGLRPRPRQRPGAAAQARGRGARLGRPRGEGEATHPRPLAADPGPVGWTHVRVELGCLAIPLLRNKLVAQNLQFTVSTVVGVATTRHSRLV